LCFVKINICMRLYAPFLSAILICQGIERCYTVDDEERGGGRDI
jgi:hypothetical protein